MRKRVKILVVSVIILIFIVLSYFSFLKLNTYLSEQQKKEQISQELISAQQKTLEETKQQIEDLRKETEEKIKSEALKNQKAITQNKKDIENQITNSAGTSSNNLVSIIQEWRPRIAYIECILRDGSRIA